MTDCLLDFLPDFLLLHGAWHGAWCWERVIPRLESQGHRATALCLPGMGERADELTAAIDFSCHARAVAEEVRGFERKPIVVAHSYAGAVVQLACEDVAGSVAGIVFLDAAILEDGERMMDLVPPKTAAERIREAKERGGVATMFAPAGRKFGLSDEDDIAYVEARFTPQPLATYLEKVRLRRGPNDPPPSIYVTCTQPRYLPLSSSRDRAIGYGWPQLEVAAGHDCMVSEPELTVDVLLRAAGLITRPGLLGA